MITCTFATLASYDGSHSGHEGTYLNFKNNYYCCSCCKEISHLKDYFSEEGWPWYVVSQVHTVLKLQKYLRISNGIHPIHRHAIKTFYVL
jgi:hypothetical protein